MDAGSGEQTLVTGFVVEGDSDRSLLVRAAGPSLETGKRGQALQFVVVLRKCISTLRAMPFRPQLPAEESSTA